MYVCSRQLALPPHLTIFHVEQEVEGNDTIALQSVLECDVERESLLKREKELLRIGNDAELVQVGHSEMCTVKPLCYIIQVEEISTTRTPLFVPM